MQIHTKTRQLTVCNKGSDRQGGGYKYFPIIQLCGNWLRESGFRAGHTVDITCEEGKIIIAKSALQRFDVI